MATQFRWALALLLASSRLTQGSEAPPAAEEALMEVIVNGERRPDWALIEVTPDGAAWSHRIDLENWGIQLADQSPMAVLAPDAFVRLNDVPGVHVNVDAQASRLLVEVQPALLYTHDFKPSAAQPRPGQSPLAAFLNYDVGASQGSGDATLMRATLEAGVVYGNWVARTLWSGTDRSGETAGVRLESNLTADYPGSRTSLQLGDTFAKLGTTGDSVRIGGFSWGTDFSVTPTFVTIPLPTVSNLIDTAGTVDLYVNGGKTQQLNVPGGPFVIAQVPVTTGAGELTVVTHDLLGRTQTMVQSYYISPQMLQAGLAAWDVQFGAKRIGYGTAADDYSGWLAAGGERYGVSDRLTAQWRLEADENGAAASGQWLALTPGNGLVTVGPYCSMAAGSAGCLLDLAYEHDRQQDGYGIDLNYSSGGYRPVAAAQRSPPPRWQVLPHFQASAPYGVSVGIGGSWRENPGGDHAVSLNAAAGKTFAGRGHLDLILSRSHGLANSSYATLVYTQSIDSRHSLSASSYSSQGQMGGAVSVDRNLPAGDGYGYSLRAAHDSVSSLQASAQWNGDDATLSGISQRAGGLTAESADMSGALLWIGGQVEPARALTRGFAVLHAADLPGLPVYLNEQRVGTTDAAGVAVLPDLRPFEANDIALDATSLPMNLDVPQTRFDVTPYRRGAAYIEVPVRLAAAVRLCLPGGDAVPAGARVRGPKGSAPVGNDGMAYVGGARGDNTLEVEWANGRCRAHLGLPMSIPDGAVDDTAELSCVPY